MMPTPAQPIDVLFVSELPLWPMDQGFRVHGSHMARALGELGVRVKIASMRPTPNSCAPWLRSLLIDWPRATPADAQALEAGWRGRGLALRRRIAEHQAIDLHALAGLVALVRRHRPAAVVALGQHGPILLQGLRTAFPQVMRIWYAADEPVYFHLSCLKRDAWRHRFRRLYAAGVLFLLERLFARGIDAAIAVSPLDAKLLRRVGGIRKTITIRNGVDLDAFAPTDAPPVPRSLIFWGRMDFEPNIDAVCWFARCVWPALRADYPDATWKIVGKNPCQRVQALAQQPGIEVTGQVEDIRPWAHEAAAVVLPMRCGGGIKNKLLEAAAMGKPILASPRAVRGLEEPPGLICRGPAQWRQAIERVWSQPDLARTMGQSARSWAQQRHTWPHAAQQLLQKIPRFALRLQPVESKLHQRTSCRNATGRAA